MEEQYVVCLHRVHYIYNNNVCITYFFKYSQCAYLCDIYCSLELFQFVSFFLFLNFLVCFTSLSVDLAGIKYEIQRIIVSNFFKEDIIKQMNKYCVVFFQSTINQIFNKNVLFCNYFSLNIQDIYFNFNNLLNFIIYIDYISVIGTAVEGKTYFYF